MESVGGVTVVSSILPEFREHKLSLMRPIIIPRLACGLDSTVLMTERSVRQLFPSLDRPFNRYVQIARFVYRVALAALPDENLIGLDELQYESCNEGIIKVVQNPYLNVLPFDSAKVSPLKSITFELSPLNAKKYKGDLVLSVEQLTRIVKEGMTGEVVSINQKMILHLSYGTFEVKVKESEALEEKESDPFDLLPDPFARYHMINEGTQYQFIVPDSSQIYLVDRLITEPLPHTQFTFSYVVIKELDLNFIQDWKQIREEIEKRKLWVPGMKMRVASSSCIVDFTLDKIVGYENEGAVPSIYKIGYRGILPPKIIVSGERIKLIDRRFSSTPLSRVEFFITSSNSGWLDCEAIIQDLISRRKVFLKDQVISIKVAERECQLKVLQIDGAGEGQGGWEINAHTVVKFRCHAKRSFELVEGSKVVQASSITISVEGSNGAPVSVDEDDLISAIKRNIPNIFVNDIVFSFGIDTRAGQQQLRLRIHEFASPFEVVIEPPYSLCGRMAPDVVFNFIEPKEKHGISIENSKPRVELKRPTPLDLIKLGIGGLSEQVEELYMNFMLAHSPLMKRQMLRRGIKPPKGLLLYGSPGTGKTTLARKLAELLGCDAANVTMYSGPEFFTKWLGESEEGVRKIRAPAKEAYKLLKEKAPLFMAIIDEIDALLPVRVDDGMHAKNSVVAQFLTEIDGLEETPNLIVIGITNCPQNIDPAALRPGRLGFHLKIELPIEKQRKEIFEAHTYKLREENLLAPDVDLDALASVTSGFSGADIEEVVKKANSYVLDRISRVDPPGDAEQIKRVEIMTREDLLRALRSSGKAESVAAGAGAPAAGPFKRGVFFLRGRKQAR